MNKEWTISDTHFGHHNIINYCKRPFLNTSQMDSYLIKAWNSVVGEQDIVYHAGDFAFGSKEYVQNIVANLNGHIILIRGNHDKFSRTKFLECGFADFHKGPLTLDNLIITHAPLETVPSDLINVHGHTHNTYIEEIDKDWYVNVGADVIGFTPILISDIRIGNYTRLTEKTGLPRQNPKGRH